jgi:hypothetical protein
VTTGTGILFGAHALARITAPTMSHQALRINGILPA